MTAQHRIHGECNIRTQMFHFISLISEYLPRGMVSVCYLAAMKFGRQITVEPRFREIMVDLKL